MKTKLLLLFLLPLTLQAQTLPQFMEEVRDGSYAAVPESIWQQEEQTLIQQVQPFLQDTSQSVRLRAYGILKQLGLKSEDQQLRQEVVSQLIAGIGDTDRSISVRNTGGLKNFQQKDFTTASANQLLTYLSTSTPNLEELLLVIGFVQPENAVASIRPLIGQLRGMDRMAAWLALSRLGEEDAIQYVMQRVERQPINDDLVYEIVPYLVYTRRQEAFEFLERIIQSNEQNCLSANADNEESILCGYRVLEYIAPVMIDFPLPVDEFGELEIDDYEAGLTEVREWLVEQDGEYELVMEGY
jgi:hypothetical protein